MTFIKSLKTAFIIKGANLMKKPIHHEANCDLYANFLTHSYLSLLEQRCLYALNSVQDSTLIYSRLNRAIKSFLFIMHTSNHSHPLLEQQIFAHYIPYHYMSKSQILKYIYKEYSEGAHYLHISKSCLTLTRIKKCYVQAVSAFKKQHEYDKINICNVAFIKLYLCIIYHHFPTFKELPILFCAGNVKDFYAQVECYNAELLNSSSIENDDLNKDFYI